MNGEVQVARICPDLAHRDKWESQLWGAERSGREEAKTGVDTGDRLGGLLGPCTLLLPKAAKQIGSSAWSEDCWEQFNLLKAVSDDKK